MEQKNELQRNAVQEERRQELESYQRALDVQWMNNRMEDGRMGRCLALIEKESELERDFQERTDHAAIVNARAEEEARLGREISKLRDEEVSLLMRRHQLHENDPSLRELERKLQAGYVCRDIKQQILNNEYKRMQDRVEERQANQVMLNALYNDMEETEREEKERLEQTTQYSRDLQQQLVNKQRQKQCQYEDTLIEKKMQEDIMRTIADEDQREWQHKREAIGKMYDEMVTSQHAREAHKQKQKEMVVMEEKKIEEQQQFACDRDYAVVVEREKKMHDREEQITRMGQKTFADETARQERMDTIRQLQQQEYLERGAQVGEAAQHRQDTFREESRQDRASQLQRRQLDARQLLEEDARYQRQADARLAKEDGIEAQKERVKWEKNHQYGEDLRKQIEENKRRRKAEKEFDQQEARNQWEHDAAWREEVAHEREKIVEEHAPHLLGYLQPGVLKHDDMPFVHSGAQKDEDLAELDIDSLSVSDCTHGHPKCNAQCRRLKEH